MSGAVSPFPHMPSRHGQGQLYYWEALVQVAVLSLLPVPSCCDAYWTGRGLESFSEL